MSMMRKLFKPGKGQRVARYTAAYVNGTAVYRGDLVCWDVTAPASQGASGVLAGETLGANDFIFVILPPAAALAAQGCQAGVVEGKTIGDTDQATALTNDTIAIVQTHGVHENVYCAATSTTTGDIFLTGATTGAMTQALATALNATNATLGGGGAVVGFSLTAAATTHTRGTVSTNAGCCGFIRCDF